MAGRGRRGPPGGPGRRPRGPPRGYRQQQQDYPGRFTSPIQAGVYLKLPFSKKMEIWVHTWVGGRVSLWAMETKKHFIALVLVNGPTRLAG